MPSLIAEKRHEFEAHHDVAKKDWSQKIGVKFCNLSRIRCSQNRVCFGSVLLQYHLRLKSFYRDDRAGKTGFFLPFFDKCCGCFLGVEQNAIFLFLTIKKAFEFS